MVIANRLDTEIKPRDSYTQEMGIDKFLASKIGLGGKRQRKQYLCLEEIRGHLFAGLFKDVLIGGTLSR